VVDRQTSTLIRRRRISQTIRFGQPAINGPGANLSPRLCVAEGFLCGFDLVMPNRPFPAKDTSQCPFNIFLTNPVMAFINEVDDTGKTRRLELGCQVMPRGDIQGWTVWTFEHGMVVMGLGDPLGKERVAALWIQDDDKGKRVLRLHWVLPGQNHNWYNVYAYNTAVTSSSGDAPGGYIRYAASGDANKTNTSDKGEVSFPLDGVTDSSWSIITEDCDPKYGFLGIRTGHKCHANILPRLTVNVAPAPAQPFSCGAHEFRGAGLVLEVGSSCSSSPYGFFAYVWTSPSNGRCPQGANNYGFVVVSPSRGWTWQDFAAVVETSMASFRVGAGHDYLPLDFPNTINVPISPPVKTTPRADGTLTWASTGVPTAHTVTFRFVGTTLDQGNILADTGAPGVFGPLTADPEKWPAARGHIVAPDAPGGGWELIHSNGSGCFTVSGIPTASDPDPRGLLVDLRNKSAPTIGEPASSSLLAACP